MPRRAIVLLLAVALACVLAACSSTRTSSAAHKSSRGDAAAFDAIGAPSRSGACSRYLYAVALGNAGLYLRVTGHKVTANELATVRESLFLTSMPRTIEVIWRLATASQAGSTFVYKPIAQLSSGKLVGCVLDVRRTRSGGWAVVSAKPRILSAIDVAAVKSETPSIDITRYGKPVIYLYPERPTDVTVRLDVNGTIVKSVPDYSLSAHGWSVRALPSGRLVEGDGRAYPYLFWEADVALAVPDNGFVVASKDVNQFLRSKLAFLGLSDTESAAFIKYWSPRMKEHPYCFVRFAGSEYENTARLSVDPAPDTGIRVFMVFRPLASPISVPEQTLQPGPARKGFVVVEWGGSELGGQPLKMR